MSAEIHRELLVTLALASVAAGVAACSANIHPTVTPDVATARMAEFWQRPDNVATRDLLNGPWGTVNAPDPDDTYTFFRKKRHGNNPGMTIHDSRGREWHVKQGVEAQPEVVLSRVLSGLGYHQPPVYYLPSFTLKDEGGSHREPGGRFRLSDPALKDLGEWSWDENPFVGTPPYQGLLVMLVMLNSADLKNENNVLYEIRRRPEEPPNWFVVRDLGSSLGQVGRFNPKENRAADFERIGFITGIKDGFVAFDYHAVHRDLVEHRIRPADVVWASQLLADLTGAQWQDAFRSAGYEPAVANRFIGRIRQKITEGGRLRLSAAESPAPFGGRLP